MAKEKNLTTVTSVAAADFARLVTSAGASVKATAANLAKYIIETYNGSTVAGSAQSVKSALDSLNSKFGKIGFSVKQVSATTNFTLSNNYRGKLTLVTSNTNYCGEYIVYATGSGAVATVPIKALSGGITISGSTNTLTLTLSTTGTWWVWFETCDGAVSW